MSNVAVISPDDDETRRNVPMARPDPMTMLATAIERGANVEMIEKLMALQERWEAGNARKAFDAAIAEAKGEIPPIIKDRTVYFTSQKGRTNYRYESFAQIAKVIDPILHKHGLTYRHRAMQEAQRVRVTCIISHRDGYAEETTLEATEDHSGNKNSIQAIGSATNYLMRYTLKLALGISTTDDDDGQAASNGPVSDEQADAIQKLATEVGADINKFLAYMQAESISDIPAAQYDRAIGALESKRRAK